MKLRPSAQPQSFNATNYTGHSFLLFNLGTVWPKPLVNESSIPENDLEVRVSLLTFFRSHPVSPFKNPVSISLNYKHSEQTMARRARLVIPGLPHYIQQKGYDDSPLFFSKSDGETYQRILQTCCASAGLQILGYCFLPDEIHLLAIPQNKNSLRKGIGDSSRQYARIINEANKIPPENEGTLWADRFHSCPLQEKYTHHALHLIEWTPVLAGEVKAPHHWHYSSARTREQGEFDTLLSLHPVLKHVDWQTLQSKKPSYLQMDLIYSHINTGRPLGDPAFISSLEQKLGKRLRPRKRGRRPNAASLSEAHKSAANL